MELNVVLDMLAGIIALGWGLVVKYHPKLGGVPNQLIPYLNWLLALVVRMAGPTIAHAQSVPLAAHHAHPFWASVWGILAPVIHAGAVSLVASLVYDKFGQPVAEGPLKLKNNAPLGR